MTVAASKIRIWHPSSDAYHCEFRVLRVLSHLSVGQTLQNEKLFILDFYLLYPFLLHRASMTETLLREFRSLRVPKPKEQFLQIPDEKMLYREIAVYQRTAISNLAAKNFLNPTDYLNGIAHLIGDSLPQRLLLTLSRRNEEERPFMDFLVRSLGAVDLHGARGLRGLTGLVRRL